MLASNPTPNNQGCVEGQPCVPECLGCPSLLKQRLTELIEEIKPSAERQLQPRIQPTEGVKISKEEFLRVFQVNRVLSAGYLTQLHTAFIQVFGVEGKMSPGEGSSTLQLEDDPQLVPYEAHLSSILLRLTRDEGYRRQLGLIDPFFTSPAAREHLHTLSDPSYAGAGVEGLSGSMILALAGRLYLLLRMKLSTAQRDPDGHATSAESKDSETDKYECRRINFLFAVFCRLGTVKVMQEPITPLLVPAALAVVAAQGAEAGSLQRLKMAK